MPITAIKDAEKLCKRELSTIAPSIPTAYEAVDFDVPEGMYQRVQFTIKSPVDPVFPPGYHRENLQFQVFIFDKSGKGTNSVITRAELVREVFKKGNSYIEGTTRIHIVETPKISGTIVINGRVICPVLIDLVVEVYDY